ncbi:hypothetical protein [Promicromonospora panici]|uniref:hypothetical protein n=1 Tax=Promicromonospora panici TaxID=2219658 RepID=UPI00101BB17C|nr:hypothetical protein [Promicromonospora panici]
MNQRQVFRGVGALVGVLMLSGCGFDIGKLDYTEPEFVGSYVGDGAATIVALGEDRTFTAVGVPDEVLENVAEGGIDEVPAEIEGTWKYDSKSSADHVELTVTDADGVPAKLGELPLYVADADDLFFLPDQLGREKVMVSRSH